MLVLRLTHSGLLGALWGAVGRYGALRGVIVASSGDAKLLILILMSSGANHMQPWTRSGRYTTHHGDVRSAPLSMYASGFFLLGDGATHEQFQIRCQSRS